MNKYESEFKKHGNKQDALISALTHAGIGLAVDLGIVSINKQVDLDKELTDKQKI